ncbi:NAD-dependent epimerase/dehydratase family protein, partial [Staphylococcus aureus]
VKYDEVVRGDRPRLFRSDRPGIADGAQARDFIWVDDAVAIVLWLLANPGVSGLFNVGTAEARSYLDVARAVCRAAGRAEDVEFVAMPDEL